MNKQRRKEATELLVWKYSECIDCEFSSTCPKQVDNLRQCFSEDGLDKYKTTDALIKRTIRFICKARRNDRRQVHKENIKSKVERWFGPKPMEATLCCSDIEEFVACQKSG